LFKQSLERFITAINLLSPSSLERKYHKTATLMEASALKHITQIQKQSAAKSMAV
jgi:hypothetical protein